MFPMDIGLSVLYLDKGKCDTLHDLVGGVSILYCCFTWKAYYTAAAQTRPLFIRHVSRFPTLETRSLAFEKYRVYTFRRLGKIVCGEKILGILLELIKVVLSKKNKREERERM